MRKLSEELWSFNTRDLMRSAGCSHCSNLAIAREHGVAGLGELLDEYYVEPDSLAITYGEAFEAELEQQLLSQLGERDFQKPQRENNLEDTLELMRQGIPVIYQGFISQRQENLQFNGKPDFLVREDYDLEFISGKLTARKIGSKGHNYVAWDAKLASTAKPNYLLQIALYVAALEELGFKSSRPAGLILGSRELATFEEFEILPAMELARQGLREAIANFPKKTKLENLVLYCESKDACRVCEYPELCERARWDVDHLIQVAGINRSQIEKLSTVGITTMAQLAAATDDQRPGDILAHSFARLRLQAKLQTDYRLSGKVSYQILDDPEIAVLPKPSANDIFFDMEGFPYFPEKGGLEYLFGCVLRDDEFIPFFAHDRKAEKQALLDFFDFVSKKLAADATANIYHYASYEVTALNRLAARHGVLEQEISELIASGRLIDLYKVVKGSIMVSQSSYSIKKLEAYYHFERKSKVLDAGSSIDEYDFYRQLVEANDPKAAEVLNQITDYNRDDCVSTRALYDWLSSMPHAHSKFDEFKKKRDIKKAREARASAEREDSPEALRARKAERELNALITKTAALEKKLENFRFGKSQRSDYLATIWLALTHSMLYYNREDVIRWRDWAIRKEATFDQLHRDRKALVVQGATTSASPKDFFGLDPNKKIKLIYHYRLESGQSCFLKPDQKIFIRFSIGANQQDTDYGQLLSVAGNEIVFERTGTPDSLLFEPNAIFEYEWIPLGNKPSQVGQLVQEIATAWDDPNLEPKIAHPAMDLLLRNPPRLKTLNKLVAAQDDYLEAISQTVFDLDNSLLAIQGPPGSGKTYLASRVIARLVAAGKKVAVVANSHSAIENLLWACLEAGVTPNLMAKRSQRGDSQPKGWLTPNGNPALNSWRSEQTAQLVGGTSWNFCSEQMLADPFDYMFIDEAAQFSLVDALAVSAVSKNLVLLGDPQQLTQVIQAIHPGGVDNSALGHYMGEQQIIADDFGYFIAITRRMHPEVNKPVSRLSYQDQLLSHPDTENHRLNNQSPGLILQPADHRGNSSSSLEEANRVVQLVSEALGELTASEVLVVAPYNAQVDMIRELLEKEGLGDIAVGTVDKFQGREAMVVIVSLAASSAADAPRGLEFVLDKNRLNVALSRAKANCHLVYSPKLIQSNFRSVEELKAISRIVGLTKLAVNS